MDAELQPHALRLGREDVVEVRVEILRASEHVDHVDGADRARHFDE
ncbi:hypothetical protein AKJ09_05160 [Labilithrix luteola]|uniref:Uncharacterized protein n=1 Tax=Labilithrix luteola TaxID=1391654 RepID=A0A0K1PYM9_9BACT|nr:hypothetical protein AKJ09_05160 [Labilithrix luteola]